jgi:CRISPR-associated protein Cas2
MWMFVMFDLPVIEKKERKEATEFRNSLLDMGFEMSQYSVYMRFCTSPAQFETFTRRVEAALPENGSVNIVPITDKQYERIISFRGQAKNDMPKQPDQFHLF